MSDLIKRQAAIELAMQYCPDDDGTCSKADEDMRNLLDELENLPSAQPERSEGLYVDGYNDGYRDGWKEGREALRQEAIKAVDDLPNCYNGFSDTYDKAYIIGVLEELPSAQPDLSEYSEKLWRAAYERGMQKAQLDIVYCRECIHWRYDTDHTCRYYGDASPRLAIDFCSKRVRREDV